MFNSAYNRKIAGDIDEINRKFVTHERYVGRGRHGGAESAAGMTFSTGAVGRSAASGKMGLGAGVSGAGVSGGSFLETALGFAPLLLGLGYCSDSEDEDDMCCAGRQLCQKCRDRYVCGMTGSARPILAQASAAKPTAERKPRRIRKAAAKLQAPIEGKGESSYEVEDFEGAGVSGAGADVSGEGISGGSWLDTLSTVIKLAPLVGLGKAKDGRKANKTSPWIAHVKAFAAKHKIKYGEALSDPRASASYRKK